MGIAHQLVQNLKLNMEDTFEQDFATVELNSLVELDRLISEQFSLPPGPYSTDVRAALELVAWNLENSDGPHFEIFRTEKHSLPGLPFVASFEPNPDVWGYGETAPLAICQAALFRLKNIKVNLILTQNN